MSESMLTVLSDEFENKETGEVNTGITVIIDGVLKKVLDTLLAKSEYEDYSAIITVALMKGINQLVDETKK